MEQREFDRILNNRIASIKQTLLIKAKEYARGDRLHNFKRAAKFLQTSPEMACWGFAMKHLTSVGDIVDDTVQGVAPTLAMTKEKIGDAINYLILLETLLEERIVTDALDKSK